MSSNKGLEYSDLFSHVCLRPSFFFFSLLLFIFFKFFLVSVAILQTFELAEIQLASFFGIL